MRASLWEGSDQIYRKTLPTIGQMITYQTGGNRPVETHEEVKRAYETVLY